MSKSKSKTPVAPVAPVAAVCGECDAVRVAYDALRAEHGRVRGVVARWEASDAADVQRVHDALAQRRQAHVARAERLLGHAEAPSNAAIAAEIWVEVAAEVAALAAVAADPTWAGIHPLRQAQHRLTALQLELALLTGA